MNKNSFLLIAGIIFVLVVGGYFAFFVGKKKPSEYQMPREYGIEKEEEKEKESVYKIRGIGFKKEAWAEYKMEGYGVRFKGEKKEEIIGKMLAKFISLPIKGKEYYGIEIDWLENSPFEGINFGILFEKEGEGTYYLVKMKGAPTICMKEIISGYEEIPEYFDKKSLEKEYTVDLSIWNFVGKDEITLESGKKIKVLKFKMEEGAFGSRDLWLSPDVPTYLVLNRETIEGKVRSITLTNFGLDGGLPNFNLEDLKACEKEPLTEFPLPPEASKFFCQSDADCVCGVDKKTGQCAFGNKNFIDTSKQCFDFCTGFAGQFRIKCIDNLCQPVPIR